MAKNKKQDELTQAAGDTAQTVDAINTATNQESGPPPSQETEELEVKKVLVVVTKHAGFRRAGFMFGKDETRLLLSELTDEQVAMLKAEPMLVVTETTEDV